MSIRLKPLAEQVVVITGASSGIGLVTAREAARRGARVVLVARDEDALATIVREIAAEGGEAAYAVADVGVPGEVEAAAARAIERFGRIDTWVNDAGVTLYARLLDTPFADHERLMRTNYFGVVNGCVAAAPHLMKQGGALISLGSIVSDIPAPMQGAYAATKHAVRGYVNSLRIELLAEGAPIAVTLVKPSGIDSPIGEHATPDGRPAGRVPPPIYDPALVAQAILHCAEHPRREITVGGGGRAEVLFGTHFPALLDRLAPLIIPLMFDPKLRKHGPRNLFAPQGDGHARSQAMHGRRTSLYTAAQLHPRTAAVALGGLLAIGGALLLGRRARARA